MIVHRPLPPGTRIADYELDGMLGRGGMAIVYRAAHPDHAVPVALKIIDAATWGADAQELLEHESRLAAAVAHRNILPVYEAGAHDGHPYVAMKLERCDLGAVLRRAGSLSPERALRYVAQVAAALDAAHAHGLVHRDVKPSNVLLGEDDDGRERALVADFGVARAAFSGGGPLGGDMVGTVGYVAPEQIRGDSVDQRTDVYALGCLLYECLTGRVPFRRGSSIATLWAHLHEEPPAPSQVRPTLPAGLDAVVSRALEKDPRARFGSAGALAEAALEAVAGRRRRHEPARPEPRALPAGTVTFLFTDVEGSTRLLRTLGDEGYAAELEQHRHGVREACGVEGGIEVDTQGDAFFFAFPSAPGAVAAAASFTEALGSGPIRVRVGIHSGTPHLTSEGYVGVDVHRAARIASAGHGGQVVVSQATHALLGEDASLVSLGAHRLKDFDEPVRLYQLGEGSFPALRTIANSNLPTPASRFLGREVELYGADLLLRETRLLTISGPGGQGKTRFALELAMRTREERFSDYEDGVFACFLATLRDPALVLPTIAQALALPEQQNLSALEAMSAQLADRRMLVLLDNLEHVLDAAGEVSQLLSACPGLTLLVTSRELLRIAGETVYDLPALADDEAVALFCERAQTAPSDAIRAICERLDGIPLAIELAAARMRLLTPEQLLERLSGRLDLLKGSRDADPRQQTLRAMIEWSYDLLTAAEQQLFARLSVFAGGCTLESAEEVCDADLDTLESLLDKSLLRRMDTDAGPRFWMLETIRDFATEQVEFAGETEATNRRHAEFVLALASELAAAHGSAHEHERFLVEEGNFREVRAWAERVGDSDLQMDLVGRSWPFWWYRGHPAEGLGWVQSALAGAGRRGDSREMHVLAAGAMFAFRSGALGRMKSYAQQSLQIARDLEDERGTGWPLVFLGIAANEAGDFQRAREHYDLAASVASEVHDELLVGVVMNNLGVVATAEGDVAGAISYTERALEISRALGTPDETALYTVNLADYFYMAGRVREAVAAAKEGLALAGTTQNLSAVQCALVLLGEVAHDGGHSDVAVRLVGAADGLRGGHYLEVGERMRYDAVVEGIAASLGPGAHREGLDEGRTMTFDEAVAYALEVELDV